LTTKTTPKPPPTNLHKDDTETATNQSPLNTVHQNEDTQSTSALSAPFKKVKKIVSTADASDATS